MAGWLFELTGRMIHTAPSHTRPPLRSSPCLSVCLRIRPSRQADWSIVERGWHAHVLGEAPNKFSSAEEALVKLKEADAKVNDQYYPPWVIVDAEGKAVGTINDGDAVVIWNYRADRVIQVGGREGEGDRGREECRRRWVAE